MIASLSRFINCSLLTARTAGHVGQTFVNDWARAIGKPRRIIKDASGTSLTGEFWRELSHVYGWEMIQAPLFTPQQNGLAERDVRPFENRWETFSHQQKTRVRAKKFRLGRRSRKIARLTPQPVYHLRWPWPADAIFWPCVHIPLLITTPKFLTQ